MKFVKASVIHDTCESVRYDDQISGQLNDKGKAGIGYVRPENSKSGWLKNRLDKEKVLAKWRIRITFPGGAAESVTLLASRRLAPTKFTGNLALQESPRLRDRNKSDHVKIGRWRRGVEERVGRLLGG
ncbi:hypothetical protein F511_34231 [Dorcoceras hygrometricum]|uniref:Uncharacterized protein n=1 Tax=Dorcoceras hygrometricum TaxID=472368 RepID=A0A2Z7BM92_9LAMI|nr:hypothetical protein F511_34231 [Dorcoceras hygrometricum]